MKFHNLKPLRWQLACCTYLTDLYNRGEKHGYVQAPPGAGKTIKMALFGEKLSLAGSRVIVVGMAKLVRQHRATLVDLGWVALDGDDERSALRSPKGHIWIIATWQAVARAAQKKSSRFACGITAILFFDECHIGGSNDDNVSFPRVVALLDPQFKVYVSATGNVSSESLLGKRRKHTYTYTMTQAYKDGILNPLEMVEVHTGTRAQVEEIQKATGRNMEQLQELDHDNLVDLAKSLRDKKVDVVDAVDKIVTNRFRSMIALYFKLHLGEHAIFFCPNIEAANEAADWFNLRARKAGKRNFRSFDGSEHPFRAYAVHTKNAAHGEIIDTFESGKIPALFVVGMLQEGFDMPRLRLAFDCRFYTAWDKFRIARLLQKMGRLTRTWKGKQTSLYYFARDVLHYYKNRAVPQQPDFNGISGITEDDLLDAAEEAEEAAGAAGAAEPDDCTDAGFAKTASLAVAQIISCGDHADKGDCLGETEVPPTIVETVEVDDSDAGEIDVSGLKTRPIRVAKTAIYAMKLKDVRGARAVRRYPHTELFSITVDQAKAKLAELLDLDEVRHV